MAIVEKLIFGTPPGSPGATPGILGRSSGITQDLADEIVRLCQGWGRPPSGELYRPVFLSFPLKAKSKNAPRGAFTVIKFEAGNRLCAQAVVISGADFAAYGYNAFGLADAGAFLPWDSSTVPSRCTLPANSRPLQLSPPPSPDDVGLVDEALHQVLASHKLYLPIEQPTAESDRFLALLLEVIPEAMKKQLRFASFAPSPVNSYHLAATTTQDCDFAGWKRLMMTLVGGALSDNLEKYVKKVRDCLAFGDISVIREENRRLSLGGEPSSQVKAAVPRPQVASLGSVVTAATKTVSQTTSGPFSPVRQSVDISRPKHGQPRVGPQLAHLRGGRRQLSGAVVALLVLVLTAAGGWTYLEFFHGGDGIHWQELVSWPGFDHGQGKNRVASLLEVPNVGAVYNKQIKRINRAGMIPGLNVETDQRRGVVQLKTEAAVPLLEQVDLFLELASAGIRQGKRSDREMERLRSLSGQGEVLAVELARLELAWHSLSLAVNWQDLGNLSDSAVLARRDSLARVSAASLRVAAEDMKFGPRRKDLLAALEQTRGMKQLLALFQADQWTEQWSRSLYKAAETVSPSASSMTRAYRNSAFLLVRLKNAEHQSTFADGPFAEEIRNGSWPCAEVADILPGLRIQVGKFGQNQAPSLLAGTLALYKILETPRSVVDQMVTGTMTLEQLQDNAAVRFDPATYENYLQRLRFQAVEKSVELGKSCPSLVSEENLKNMTSFSRIRNQKPAADDWAAWASGQNDPFLQRWAHHEVVRMQEILQAEISDFESNWQDIWSQVDQLKLVAGQGGDWTGKWIDLVQDLKAGTAAGMSLQSQDPSVAGQVDDLQNLLIALEEPRAMQLEAVTIRLDQDRLQASAEAVFEFNILPKGRILRSRPFTIGPAAPAGSGWVGTVVLDRQSRLAPNSRFQGTVRLVDGGRELLKVQYPSLAEGVGPAAMSRPRSAPGGNMSVKTGDGWWRNIRLPRPSNSVGAF